MGISTVVIANIVALFSCVVNVGADQPYHIDLDSYQNGALGETPQQSFYSSPITSPIYQINHFNVDKIDASSPYMFMAGHYGRWGPSIVSSKDLSLVWADQNYDGLAQTARTWTFKGRRVMTSYSDDRVRIYDENYKQLHVVKPEGSLDGIAPDSHEAMLTTDDTVLMIVCPIKEVDLSGVGGPKEGGKVADCHVQEVDPETNKVLFQFATLDYFAPEDSVMEYSNEDVWDFCHMNAVEKTTEGNFLVSYRHLSTVIMVNGNTNKVMWVMGGKRNMFKDVSHNGSAEFRFQHEARVSGKNRFTLFDNHRTITGYCEKGQCSRGLEVEYDPEAKTAWKVNEWYHPQKLMSGSRGGLQRTPGGNMIIAWGQNPMYTEYTADGELVMDIQRGQVLPLEHGISEIITYRIWKGDWVGSPSWKPNISCNQDDKGTSVYVSWNGATEVHSWVLLMSDKTDDLDGADKVMAQSPRNGFETQFHLGTLHPFARVAALDTGRNIIGSTPAVDTRSNKIIELEYNITEVVSAGHKSITGVPSSTRVEVPTGSSEPRTNMPSGDSHSEPPLVIILGAFTVITLIVSATIGLVVFLRRRTRAEVMNETIPEVSSGLLYSEARVAERESQEYEDKRDTLKGGKMDSKEVSFKKVE